MGVIAATISDITASVSAVLGGGAVADAAAASLVGSVVGAGGGAIMGGLTGGNILQDVEGGAFAGLGAGAGGVLIGGTGGLMAGAGVGGTLGGLAEGKNIGQSVLGGAEDAAMAGVTSGLSQGAQSLLGGNLVPGGALGTGGGSAASTGMTSTGGAISSGGGTPFLDLTAAPTVSTSLGGIDPSAYSNAGGVTSFNLSGPSSGAGGTIAPAGPVGSAAVSGAPAPGGNPGVLAGDNTSLPSSITPAVNNSAGVDAIGLLGGGDGNGGGGVTAPSSTAAQVAGWLGFGPKTANIIGNNLGTGLQVATGAGGIAMNAMNAEEASKQEKALAAAAASLGATGTQWTAGNLPQGVKDSIAEATNSAVAATQQQYQKMGLGGSTMEAQAVSDIYNRAQQQASNTALALMQQGASASGVSAQLLSQLMAQQNTKDTNLSNSITGYVKALSGGSSLGSGSGS